MNVVNIHSRIINQPIDKVSGLLETLSTVDDKIWPKDKWPPMRFNNGLKVGERGGHGIIRYSVEAYELGELVIFKFLKPKKFNGIHKFEIKEINAHETKVKHSIIMKTEGFSATFKWLFIIKWLHDALIENAFDTVENNFLEVKKHTKWNVWVSLWRFLFKLIR